MVYDVVSKVIFERCKKEILKFLCGLDIEDIEVIEERPRETASLRRSDFIVKGRLKKGEEIVESCKKSTS
jgi:hypothetical protein